MDAKRCDRCGAYYMEKDEIFDIPAKTVWMSGAHRVRNIVRADLVDSSGEYKTFDLCNNCAKQTFEFMKGEKNG